MTLSNLFQSNILFDSEFWSEKEEKEIIELRKADIIGKGRIENKIN